MAFPSVIGKKVGMTSVFTEDGSAVPVTVVELLPLTVTQVKTKETDGYEAVQVGFIEAKEKHVNKPRQGQFKKRNLPLFRKLREIRVENAASYNVGDVINPTGEQSPLSQGLHVDVIGRSIGKGFQGNTKMWNHHRGLMSHGSKSHRLPGSIGAGTTPGRVFKGLNMPRNMGNVRVTTKNLEVIRVIAEKNVVLIRGTVPGVENSLVTISPVRTKWNQN